MSEFKNINGRFCESDYEYALISFLENEGWVYSAGLDIAREYKRDVLIIDDLKDYLNNNYSDLSESEVKRLIDSIKLVGAETDFATLHKFYKWIVDGFNFQLDNGETIIIDLINFEKNKTLNNIFKVVNQLSIEYINNGKAENRRPDILLYINGIPVCVMELKNPSDANATIHDAWEQINIRYWRDLPHLLHYCPLACISDGVKTRLGTVRAPYEHFYAWRRVNSEDKVSTLPFEETMTMVKGVYTPERFLEIFRDYIYFQDTEYDRNEVEIVCRYPQ